jgi:hypothetical protein
MHSAVEIPCLEAALRLGRMSNWYRRSPVQTQRLVVRGFQRSHECFAQVAGAAGDEDFHIDSRLDNIRSDGRGSHDISRGCRSATATRITNCNAAISDMSRAADYCAGLALWCLLHKGGPRFPNPKSIYESQTGRQPSGFVPAGWSSPVNAGGVRCFRSRRCQARSVFSK